MATTKIHKVPGRRAGAKAAAIETLDRLNASEAAIDQAGAALVQISQELGLNKTVANQPEELTLEIDPRVCTLAPVYVRALSKSPSVQKTAQVDPNELETLHSRARALGLFLFVLEQFQAELSGSRLIIAAAQGQLWDDLVSQIMGDLADERIPREERESLRDHSREIVAQAETEDRIQKQRREELKDSRTKANEQIAAAALRRKRLQALLQLQEQQEIEPDQLDELLRIYHDQLRVPTEDQRSSKR